MQNENKQKKLEKYSVAVNLDEEILNELTTEDEIKKWLAISIEEYLDDNDTNSFFRSLEIAAKAKDLLSHTTKKTDISKSNIYAMFNGEVQPQFNTVMKVFKELGYSLTVN